jgi:hypothetical protein
MRDNPGALGWISRHPKFFVMSLVVLVGVLSIAGLGQQARRSLARRIAAIRAKGEPTTVQDLISRLPDIPDDENMTIALLPHCQTLGNVKLGDGKDELLPLIGMARLGVSGEPMSAAQLDTSSWYLEQIKKERRGIHLALRKPHGHMKMKLSTPMITVVLPELSTVRQVSKIVNLEALVLAERGDSDAAADVLVDAFAVSVALNGTEFLINGLVQIAVDALALDTAERSINLCKFSEQALAKLQDSVRKRDGAVNLRAMYETERVMFLDTFAWLRSGGGQVSAFGPPSSSMVAQAWQYVPVLPALDAAGGLDHYSRLVDAVREPSMETIRAVQAMDPTVAQLPIYCIFSKLLVPSLSRCAVLWVRSIGQNRALQAAIAAERHRVITGRWPDALQELAPRYLDAVPLDPFDGKPIRYAKIPEGIKTWTISDEFNNQDDGGDVCRLEKQTASRKPRDFGWVILNPELRGKMTTTRPAKPN